MNLSAEDSLWLMAAVNVFGALFLELTSIDYVAHLGGQATGLLYYQYALAKK